MENAYDNVVELKKYYDKLSKIITESPGLVLMKVKVIDKRRVDDILVCIEASYPSFYKKYLDLYGGRSLKSHKLYILLMEAIKNKFMFSTSKYAIKFDEALTIIKKIRASLEPDFNYITTNCPDVL